MIAPWAKEEMASVDLADERLDDRAVTLLSALGSRPNLSIPAACGGRAVQGATVFAVAIPYNQFAPAQGTTAADGTVSLTETRQSGFPVSRHQHLLAVFVRASKQGEPTTAGISTSRVAAFHIAHH